MFVHHDALKETGDKAKVIIHFHLSLCYKAIYFSGPK
jgi:hypothetical protein